jgi:hypothetical protein
MTNKDNNTSKLPTMLMSRPTSEQHVKTANYVDIETNDGAAGGVAVAGEGTVHEE